VRDETRIKFAHEFVGGLFFVSVVFDQKVVRLIRDGRRSK
jgi:hypothetical protein